MKDDKINIDKVFNHWFESSDKDYNTMLHLYSSKDYHWALFLGHLVIEKLLKAVIIRQTEKHALFSHDLRRLAKQTDIDFSKEQTAWLDTTTFNLNARYDSYKQDFYKKCTSDFTTLWINNIKSLQEWIKKKL